MSHGESEASAAGCAVTDRSRVPANISRIDHYHGSDLFHVRLIFGFSKLTVKMGNSFFCNRCDIEKFELSRTCADQFLDKDNQDAEQRWMQKLKCIDNIHSKQKGLTPEAFNELLDKVEKNLKSKEIPVYCKNRDFLIECLARNPNCMLNCMREMNDFIDCVDTLRVRKMKQRIQESMKKKPASLAS